MNSPLTKKFRRPKAAKKPARMNSEDIKTTQHPEGWSFQVAAANKILTSSKYYSTREDAEDVVEQVKRAYETIIDHIIPKYSWQR